MINPIPIRFQRQDTLWGSIWKCSRQSSSFAVYNRCMQRVQKAKRRQLEQSRSTTMAVDFLRHWSRGFPVGNPPFRWPVGNEGSLLAASFLPTAWAWRCNPAPQITKANRDTRTDRSMVMNASKPAACRAINGHLCWLPSSRLQVIPSTVGRLLSVVYFIKAKPT